MAGSWWIWGRTRRNFLALGLRMSFLELGCLQRGTARDWGSVAGRMPPWASAAPMVLAGPSPKAFPDGMTVFGCLDSKDDAGDQEEGAPPHTEPEGILEQGEGLTYGLGSDFFPSRSAPQRPTESVRGMGGVLRAEGKG